MQELPPEIADAILKTGHPPLHRRIFVNRNLRMDSIEAIGFDMDYTLARYFRQPIENLAYTMTIDRLIDRGYPKDIRNLPYDGNFVIRGLTVDKELGNTIKLDRHSHASIAYHGRDLMDKETRRDLYRRDRIRFDAPRFIAVDTFFSLPEICLFANLVDFFDKNPKEGLDPWQIYEDVRICIDAVHRDGSMKSIIKSDIGKYIETDPLLSRTLHKLRSAGKKLFVLTNSMWDYTNNVMSFLLGDGKNGNPNWRTYFDAVVVGANKPNFWSGDEPLVKLNDRGIATRRGVKTIEKGGLFMGGNAEEFEKAFGYAGDQILYVGDHLYGDIVRSKRNVMWRTALVVEELEDEIQKNEEASELIGEVRTLEIERRRLDELCNIHRQNLLLLEKSELNGEENEQFNQLRAERDKAKSELKQTLSQREDAEESLDKHFNQHWGRVFKQGQANSRIGQQIERYACIYTSRVSNFFFYSSYQYFRSPADLLPHER
ncbi:MAG: HAD-IG family 5'-nucleotidase [Myxococcota bacterium]|nr:HAD-IG family 5'-nucleotidase [Myxococcota bacterium]